METSVYTQHWKDYELLDAGNDKKLERWGNIITIRPERNAYFKPVWNYSKWQNMAHFEFNETSSTKGNWVELKNNSPKEWTIQYKSIHFHLKLTQFKHLGIFPEQRANWDFIAKRLNPNDRFLNLFGYTGGASIMANQKGADVFHCDSIKQINAWAKENMLLSNQNNIHWVLDDAMKFANREVKREKKYKGIIMDPPAFGLGAKKERWKIETKFPQLIETASLLLEKDGFLVVNTYSPRLSVENIEGIVKSFFPSKNINISKLCMKTSTGKTIEYGELTRVY